MKLKIKIVFVMTLLFITMNTAYAYEVYEGNFASTGSSQTTNSVSYSSAVAHNMDTLAVKDGGQAIYLTSVTVMAPYYAWSGSDEVSYYKDDVIYEYNTETVGTGYMYYWLQDIDHDSTYDYVFIKCYFDNGLSLSSGAKKVTIVGDITSDITFDRSGSLNIVTAPVNIKSAYLGDNSAGDSLWPIEAVHKAFHTINFYNNYSYWYDKDLFTFYLNRNDSNPSSLCINNGYMDLINETSSGSSSIYIYSDDLTNHTWDIELLDTNSIVHELEIDFNPEPEDLTPTLTTDKINYNTTEELTISYTNIDEFYNSHSGYKYEKPYSLYILYPVTEPDRDFRTKFYQPLYYDLRDETFTINTSILTPQTEYFLAIVKTDSDFGNANYHLITSDTFYVIPDNEYISTSCNPNGNCYTGNGNPLDIFYNINNNSNIYVKDNDGNIVSTYYGVSGEGVKHYQIPFDENKFSSYPNWKIYINNTEYETSYNTDVTVYWSLFIKPTPTPTPTPYEMDTNVSEQIDNLKEESKPLFDFIYGLSTILIDNPDYDKNNLVDENEVNMWFNSLVPLGIILLIICLYIGLTKRG